MEEKSKILKDVKDKNVKFYSVNDLSCGYNLEKAEIILKNCNEKEQYDDINAVIELYNIQLYLKNDCYLKKWTSEQIELYKKRARSFTKYIGKYFSIIDDKTIEEIYSNIQYRYYDDFWALFAKFKLYDNISNEIFDRLIRKYRHLSFTLVHKQIVYKYDQILSKIMMDNIQSCELLLEEYLAVKDRENSFYFPNSLDKIGLIDQYINFYDANLNYLNLIVNSLGTKDLQLTDKIRLKARRRYEEKIKVFSGKEACINYGVSLLFSKSQEVPVKINYEKHMMVLSYSQKWLKENLGYEVVLIYNFIYNFFYVDNQMRFRHVHKLNLMSVFERILGVKGKHEYIIDSMFNQINAVAQLQMSAYYNFLRSENINLEKVCKWFFEEYINREFDINGFFFNNSSINSNYLEKNRTLNSEIDSILKQFKMWCDDKYIDLELLQISSNHMFFKDIPSLIDKKYIYPNDEEFYIASYLLCSDQSPIHYISEKYKSSKFHELIDNYNLKIDDFHNYQYNDINWLINHEYIYLNDNGFLKKKTDIIWIIDELYFNDVLSYYHIDKNKQKMVDYLLERGILRFESSLFSKPETDYLNYIFNKSEFSNGLDIRNKYIHGTQSMDVKTQEEDYFTILRMIILCILKINDEFCLEYELKKVENNII